MICRAAMLVLICLTVTSCAKVRDFGCLTNGYWVAAPSHAETAIYDTKQTAVLERSVTEIGVVGPYVVARCTARAGGVSTVAQERPCAGVNVVDTGSGRVWQGVDDAGARVVLAQAGRSMPTLQSVNAWFNDDWPDGNPSAFCRATYANGAAPAP